MRVDSRSKPRKMSAGRVKMTPEAMDCPAFPVVWTMLFSRMLALPKALRMEMERTEMGILTAVTVAQQNILPRECPRLMRNPAILQQSNHTRHRHLHPCRMQCRALFFLSTCHSLQHQHQSTPRSANIDRLIRRIQNQHRSLHRRLAKYSHPNIHFRQRTPGIVSAGVPHVSFPTQPLLPHLPRLHL